MKIFIGRSTDKELTVFAEQPEWFVNGKYGFFRSDEGNIGSMAEDDMPEIGVGQVYEFELTAKMLACDRCHHVSEDFCICYAR